MIAALQALARHTTGQVLGLARWWLQEVQESWLELLERLVPQRARRFVIELQNEGGIVRQIGAGVATASQQFQSSSWNELPAPSTFWNGSAPLRARALVALPSSSVLMCRLHLPPGPERDVDRMVELQLIRELPISEDQVYVDWEIGEKHADQSRTVSVVIARRADVDRLRDAIHAWGWTVLAIGIQGDGHRPRFNFLPAGGRGLDMTLHKDDWRLVYSASALAILYCVVVAGQWWFERSSLAERLQQARAAVAAVEQRNAELNTRSAPALALRDVMRSSSAAEALVAVSTAVPAEAWIQQMEIRSAAAPQPLIKLEAYAPSAANLIEHMQRNGAFDQVQLIKTVTADIVGGDRVELSASLREARQP